MKFINRSEELGRLDNLMAHAEGALAVLYGRRRIGKTRLLLEWSSRHGGLYTVADQSTPDIQRRYFAETVAGRLPGFADVEYRDWRGLLTRLAREARHEGWRGPLIFDELPYLVVSSPELPSVLQRWIDHEARTAGLVVAVAGSSQRMMQGLVLSRDAPLFGRAREILDLRPLDPTHLHEAFGPCSAFELVETFTAWGGVPRYWELASDLDGGVMAQLESLVLDPMGPLHREPDRLLLEEMPSALETRPVLDAIGAGVHRVSEIAGRLGRPATSMSRPLDRLVEMGLVRREVPFGESEKKSRRALYKIDDPFFRLWFRVVAPHRGQMAASPGAVRMKLLERYWKGLVGSAWEELCRQRLPRLEESSALGRLGPWGPASRWWQGASPEWDLVSESIDGRFLLLGQAKWSSHPFTERDLDRLMRAVNDKPPPRLSGKLGKKEPLRVVFIPELEKVSAESVSSNDKTLIVTTSELISQT